MTLIDRLCRLAQLWATAQGRELSTLGTLVAKDGKFFNRLGEGKTCTVALFERFLLFFREPGNWPEESIPADAAALLDEVEMIAVGSEPSIGREMQISAHDLMAPISADSALPSATKTSEIICSAGEAGPDPFPVPAAGASPHPPLTGVQVPHAPPSPPISPTCSETSAPPPPPAASRGCSTAGEAEAA
jgi:hypothetical protein